MKRLAIILGSISLCVPLASSLRAAPITGVIVQTAYYDATKKAVVVRLVNTSQQEVTGVCLSLALVYADGTNDVTERVRDLADGRYRFMPGATRDEVVYETQGVTKADVVVDVVAYADQTAEVGKETSFGRLIAIRKGRLLAQQKINEIINQKLADPKAPVGAAATELRRLADVENGRHNLHPDDPEAWVKEYFYDASSEIQRDPSPERLKAMVKRGEEQIAAITPHTKLTKKEVVQ
jgi:hypothetical protein